MNDISFIILKCVISIATALITAYLIPYLKSQIDDKEQEKIYDIVCTAVQAAQQTINNNELKKEMVTNYVSRWLDAHKIKMTPDQLDNLIESAVYEMKQMSK